MEATKRGEGRPVADLDLVTVEQTKICSTCRVRKPIERFRLRGEPYSSTPRYRCKDCENSARRGNAKARNPADRRRRKLRWKYGITVEDFDKLWDLQKGRCKCCGKKFTATRYGKACVDHCHNTGFVRGIICGGCNFAEGILGTAENALALHNYMKQNELFGKCQPAAAALAQGGDDARD